MGFFGRGLGIPVIQRTARPAIVGTPVWYAEASTARTTLDISITIPSGNSRKLVVLWGSNGAQFPTAVTFDPAGAAVPMIPIDETFGSRVNLSVAVYYLDTPAEGPKVVRIITASAVFSVVSAKVIQNARAGLPQTFLSDNEDISADRISVDIKESDLVDAFSETIDLVLAAVLPDGALTPFSGQRPGADTVVNSPGSSFLATTSDRTHDNNGSVKSGWDASSSTDLLMVAVNIPFSSGQTVVTAAVPISEWKFDNAGTVFVDTHHLRDAAVEAGTVLNSVDPLFDDPVGASISVQDTAIKVANHADYQVASWSMEIYLQPREWPATGTNAAVLCKDIGAFMPGGWQLEVEATGAIDWYIRSATDVAIKVTGASGHGTLTRDVAHVIHLTYDDITKTAAIYLKSKPAARPRDRRVRRVAEHHVRLMDCQPQPHQQLQWYYRSGHVLLRRPDGG